MIGVTGDDPGNGILFEVVRWRRLHARGGPAGGAPPPPVPAGPAARSGPARPAPSLRPFVRPFVRPSVRPSVRPPPGVQMATLAPPEMLKNDSQTNVLGMV